MPLYSCKVCGRPSRSRYGCPAHRRPPARNGSWSRNRDRSAQRRFRRQLIERDGEKCSTPGCPVTVGLRACHIVPLSEGGSYDPSNGVLRCRAHDRETDPHAR